MKKLLLALVLCLVPSIAWAQNPQCPDRPNGDSTNACANTRFVINNGGGGGGGSVTYNNITSVPGHRFLGNNTGSTANAIALTDTQATAELNDCSALLKGLVPTPPNTTTTFLRGDCTFAAPPAAAATGYTYINVTCNGSDVGAAINTALTGGAGTYVLPPGTCGTSVSILPKTFQWLRGSGRDQTTIQAIGTPIVPTVLVDQQDNVIISDLSINHNGGSANCVLTQFSQNFSLLRTNCYFPATGIGVQYKTITGNGSNYYNISNNLVYGASQHGMFFTYSNNGLVFGNVVYGYTFAGINVSAGTSVKIESNQIFAATPSSSGYGAIRLTPCDLCPVVGNSAYQPSIGVTINGGLASSVTGNTIYSPYYQGFAITHNNSPVTNANFNSMTGNTVLNPYVAAGTGCAFEVADFGVADGAQGNVFTGNTAIDQVGHMTKMFCNTITGGGPTYANKYDAASNQASGVLGP